MTREEAKSAIERSLAIVLDRKVEVADETDLLEDEIVDSLDAATFVFELEGLTGVKLPEGDLGDHGLYKVGRLVEYLCR